MTKTIFERLPTFQQALIAACSPPWEAAYWEDLRARKGEMEIKLTVNGFEFDFDKFAEGLNKSHNEHIQAAARELVLRQHQDLVEKLTRIERAIADEFDGTQEVVDV